MLRIRREHCLPTQRCSPATGPAPGTLSRDREPSRGPPPSQLGVVRILPATRSPRQRRRGPRDSGDNSARVTQLGDNSARAAQLGDNCGPPPVYSELPSSDTTLLQTSSRLTPSAPRYSLVASRGGRKVEAPNLPTPPTPPPSYDICMKEIEKFVQLLNESDSSSQVAKETPEVVKRKQRQNSRRAESLAQHLEAVTGNRLSEIQPQTSSQRMLIWRLRSFRETAL